MIYKQKGHNPDYPIEAEVWDPQKEKTPEWLIDRVKIKSVDEDGNAIIDTREFNTGGYEILMPESKSLKMETKDSVILCSETHPLFSLSLKKFNLLYEPKYKIKKSWKINLRSLLKMKKGNKQ